MRTTIFILFWLLQASVGATGSSHKEVANPISSALGYTLFASPHFENPATTIYNPARCAYANYHNKYGVKELGDWEASILYPAPWAHQRLHFEHFGFEHYHYTSLNYGIGKKLSERWSLGTAIRLKHLHFTGDQEDRNILQTDIGLTWMATSKITAEVLIQNWFETEISPSEENCESGHTATIGGCFQMLDNARWCFELEETQWKDWRIKNGFEFSYERASFRCGCMLFPVLPTLGIGFGLSHFRLDLSSSFHNQLGYSIAIGIGSQF
ncbi:MAG: hypothetical protein J6Y37_05250 [Paludibacteraceae bacterium]|nr:hypothetical protein [Paludibacteraceae bacterium]